MSIDSILKIIRTPDDVLDLAQRMGYNMSGLLDTCGIEYNTFQYWRRNGKIPNKSALILFNYIHTYPSTYPDVRMTKDVVMYKDVDND